MAAKRGLPPTYFLLSLVAVIVLHLVLPLGKIIPYPFNLLGIVFIVTGGVLNLVGDRAFKKHGTTVRPFEESSALITTGVYGVSRHAMYLGMALIIFGLALLLGAVFPFLVVPAFVVLIEVLFIRTEEAMLNERFRGGLVGLQKQGPAVDLGGVRASLSIDRLISSRALKA